ncbi:phosphomannomutase, putative [Pediculus humanus corporis]|uniref:Phosphomannomutase n=1 Tax=Pediculus humanus subsp. corporis TaxID=121224 RepID=E0VN46_PEDHC|nr:phosphomannomutase, putative [Pediculus humanus corporis]EEB14812.1 phosphomannomutase, putative [Pediculus humanus corporis]
MSDKKKILCLFDVDGTLTEPRKIISTEMKDFLMNKVRLNADIALVGGSDLQKISEQMGGFEVLSKIPFVFSENGLVAHKYGVEFSKKIHFFGDKTEKGENDYEIFTCSKVIGHKVTSPSDTMEQLKTILNIS